MDLKKKYNKVLAKAIEKESEIMFDKRLLLKDFLINFMNAKDISEKGNFFEIKDHRIKYRIDIEDDVYIEVAYEDQGEDIKRFATIEVIGIEDTSNDYIVDINKYNFTREIQTIPELVEAVYSIQHIVDKH